MYNQMHMRILGIDPGIGRTGWGIIEQKGNSIKALAYDCFETPPHQEVPIRLEAIYHHITDLIATYHPDAMGIEDLFFNNNAKTAMVVGQARGVVLLAAQQQSLPIGIYTPLQVKIAVAGYGRAEKAQVGQMVKVLLGLDKIPKPDDTADALAIALTYAFSYKINRLK